MLHRKTGGSDRRGPVLLALLTLAAFALRLFDLGRLPLWEDEGATWWYARLVADGRLMEGIRLEPTPPLYYLLVAGVTAVFGASDWAMRFPSVVFGTLSIPVVFWLTRSLGRSLDAPVRHLAAWSAAVLLAVHPLHVFYSREARVYPLLLLMAMLLWLALRRALDDDSGRSWATVATLLLVVSYLHYYSLFLFATAGALVLVQAGDARRRLRGLAAVVAPGLLFLPYVALTLPHLRESGAAWSIDALYAIFPGDRSFLRVLEMGMVGADYPIYLRQIAMPPTAGWLRWTAVAVQVALVAWALRAFLVRDPAQAARRRNLVFWLTAWFVPLLLPWAITHGFRAIFHPGRHDVYALWGLVFGVAVGLGSLLAGGRRRRTVAALAALAGLLLLVAAMGRLAQLHATPANDTVRERAAWIDAALGESELDPVAIWTLGVTRVLTERYVRLARPDLDGVSISSFPASTDRHPGWSDARALMEDRDAVLTEARHRVATLEPSVDTVLVVTAGPPPRPDGGLTAQGWIDMALIRTLEQGGWTLDAERSRPDLDLLVFGKP